MFMRRNARKVINMTYHELVKKVQTALAKADASKVEGHIAVQVNVTGEAEGAFYMEIADGVLYVAPYDYNDRDALLTADGADILAVAQGKLSLEAAIAEGKVAHEGDYDKTLTLGATIPVKKAAAKKTAEKKTEKTEAPKKVKKAEEEAPAEKPKKSKKTVAAKTEETVAEAVPAPAVEEAPAAAKKSGRKPAAKKTEEKEEKPKRSRKTTKKEDK